MSQPGKVTSGGVVGPGGPENMYLLPLEAKSRLFTTNSRCKKGSEKFIGHSLRQGALFLILMSTLLWNRLPLTLIILKALTKTMHAILMLLFYISE